MMAFMMGDPAEATDGLNYFAIDRIGADRRTRKGRVKLTILYIDHSKLLSSLRAPLEVEGPLARRRRCPTSCL